ncbi:MAG: Zn-dependent hydrolase [Paracoccus sp. (in: a-proteobacteria)]|uniref:Zn-dependent hydrolase n=1 Tax=Paracoccus sp. TaxID=267 RepID=UPI0026DFD1FE|nr:Zn-dependent hydrolase [Paracoccus sp. (in: a-proteobacteria)]MDO5613677.1 Zn-dependent hydrolase [Paracoccus sp. (in: a-proteobacteria)]
MTSNLRTNPARLWDSLMQMAEIGPGVAGGNNRQTATDADGQARALLRDWAEAEGMALVLDRMGNMFLRLEGADADAAPVMLGSHLDTQPTGGKFDGVLGVLAGLEVIRTIREAGLRTRHPIVLVNWTNEEGARFAPAMMGSAVFAGLLEEADANARTDLEGLRFGDELARIGWRGDAAVGGQPIHAFFEYHIEQGPILEAEGIPVGIVTHGQGLRWIECRITGRASHAGSTPMGMRADAGRGAARLIEAIHAIAMTHQPDAVATVGHIEVFPNSRNVIPEAVVLTADMRSHRPEVLAAMQDALLRDGPAICAELDLDFKAEVVGQFQPPAFDPVLLDRLRAGADRLGLSHRDIVSGAGHDACNINIIAPTAMLFCPCEGGLSHNEAEAISPEWAASGADVLLHAVLETAGVVTD